MCASQELEVRPEEPPWRQRLSSRKEPPVFQPEEQGVRVSEVPSTEKVPGRQSPGASQLSPGEPTSGEADRPQVLRMEGECDDPKQKAQSAQWMVDFLFLLESSGHINYGGYL